MSKEIVTKQKAVTFIVQDPAHLAGRLKNLIVNGKKLSDEECLALAQYSVATDLNPFVGECYFLPSIGPGPGIAGWRKKAEEMMAFEAEKAKIPAAKFWCEYLKTDEGEAHYIPEKGDIAVKAILHDEISRTKWEKRILGYFIDLIKNGVAKDEGWKLANELAGSEPTWSAVAVVHGSENFGPTEKYDRYERCCKRAEKLAIRKRFPLINLPEPVGFDESYIDAEARDITGTGQIAAPKTEAQIMNELGYETKIEEPKKAEVESNPKPINGNGRPYTPGLLIQKLDSRSVAYIGKTATTKQRGLLAMLLEKCFAGEGSELKRKAFQVFLFDRESLNDFRDSLVLAMLNDWLQPVKDSGGDFIPNDMAVREANLAYTAALQSQGQTSMTLNPETEKEIPEEFK
jgi:hypothetical protein